MKKEEAYQELIHGDRGDITKFCLAIQAAHSYPSGFRALLEIQQAATEDQGHLGRALRSYLSDWAADNNEGAIS